MIQAPCPSCATQIRFVSKASLYAVCPACDNLVLRKDLDVERVGALGHVQEDGTPIQLGTRGTHAGATFEVVGRIQLQFPTGFWNEWHAQFRGDRSGWLGEAQGTYVVTFLTRYPERPPEYRSLRAGQPITIAQREFIVKEVQEAMCVGGEGELPFRIESDTLAPVVDLATHGKEFATLDYSETPPLLFLGEQCEFDELKLENVRKVEGW